MKTMFKNTYPVSEENLEAALAAVRNVYPQATAESNMEVLGVEHAKIDECAPYGVPGFHKSGDLYVLYCRIDGRLMEICFREGNIQKRGKYYPFCEITASAEAGRTWLNEKKARAERDARERKAYGIAAQKAAEEFDLPVPVVMAIGPENAEEFSDRVDEMECLSSSIEWDLGCGARRRKDAIFAALKISKESESPLADKIRNMGQIHSQRVAEYIAGMAPAGDAVVYSC